MHARRIEQHARVAHNREERALACVKFGALLLHQWQVERRVITPATEQQAGLFKVLPNRCDPKRQTIVFDTEQLACASIVESNAVFLEIVCIGRVHPAPGKHPHASAEYHRGIAFNH